jgi:response regulator RpfG family c-di-GMP phosphodiesterase
VTRPTILCVDDEANVLKALKRLLRKEPYEIITASSGDEALEIIKHVTPEVVISDQRMPGMQGTELLQQVKHLLPETVRVVLSGYADASSILEAINLGHIFRFLTKPWQDDQLKEAINQCVQQYEIGIQNRRLLEQVALQNQQLKRWNESLEVAVQARTYSLQLAQDVLAKLPWPILGIDADGQIALMNEAACAVESPFQHLTPGTEVAHSLPGDWNEAITRCLTSPNSDDAYQPIEAGITVKRLGEGKQVRGCLVAFDPAAIASICDA